MVSKSYMLFSFDIATILASIGFDKATECILVGRGTRTTIYDLLIASGALKLRTIQSLFIKYSAFVLRESWYIWAFRVILILHLIFLLRRMWGRLLFEGLKGYLLLLVSSWVLSEGVEAHLGDFKGLFELFGAGRTFIINLAFSIDHLYLFIIAVVRVLIIIIMARVLHVLAFSLALS